MENTRCPRCRSELALAKLRPEAIPTGPDGEPLPGPYLLCVPERLIISAATGEPEVIGGLPRPPRRRGQALRRAAPWFWVAYPLLLAGAAVTLTVLWRGHHGLTTTGFTVGMGALWALFLLGTPGLLRSDRHGNALVYAVRPAAGDLADRLRRRLHSYQATRAGRRWKRGLRRVLAELASAGPGTAEELAARLGVPEAVVAERLPALVWRRWVAEVPSAADGPTRYAVTSRGRRELDRPGSTDDEPL